MYTPRDYNNIFSYVRINVMNQPPHNLPDLSTFASFHLVSRGSLSAVTNVRGAHFARSFSPSHASKTKSVPTPATNLPLAPSTGTANPTGPASGNQKNLGYIPIKYHKHGEMQVSKHLPTQADVRDFVAGSYLYIFWANMSTK